MMATYSRYWIFVSILVGLLGSCSSGATDPVAVNPEAVSSVAASSGVEGTQLSADLSRQVQQAEAMDAAEINSLPTVRITGVVQRLPLGIQVGRQQGSWIIDDKVVVVLREPLTQVQVDEPVVGDTVSVTGREFNENLIIASQIVEDISVNRIVGTLGGDTLHGTADIDSIKALSGNDTINGKEEADQIATGSGSDTVVYNSSQLGSGPDQLSDWAVNSDRFRFNAGDFSVVGPLTFINTLAANLPNSGVNVIVLQDTDNDNDPATAFNARSAARLIGNAINQPEAGFFIYWNSGLGVNRLVYTPDLSNGEAPLTILNAINTLSGQDAINALPTFRADNFAFN
jgi:Ca2+-binding RTX toxin-like protein